MIERTFTPDQLNNWGIPYGDRHRVAASQAGNGDRDRTAEYRDVITGRLETIANQADAEGHPACADAIRKTFREVAEEL